MIVKTEHSSYLRDTHNKALINKDKIALKAYKSRKRANRNTTERLNKIESDLSEIKALLRKLVE